MLKKIFSILIFIAILVVGFSQKDTFVHLIKHGGTVSILTSMILVAICVFFPIIPFTALAGMIGALFGTLQAALISLSGSMIGTIIFFFISRYGFKDWAQNKLNKYPKIQEYQDFLNQRSFIAVLTARLIPVIPAPVINIVCGLSKVNWGIFFIASALGKIPNIVILSFAGAHVMQNKWLSFGIYGLYLLIIFIINFIFVYKKMDKNQQSQTEANSQ